MPIFQPACLPSLPCLTGDILKDVLKDYSIFPKKNSPNPFQQNIYFNHIPILSTASGKYLEMVCELAQRCRLQTSCSQSEIFVLIS